MNAQIQEINTVTSNAPQAISAMDAMMNAEIMTHVNNLAQVMASSKVTVPKHLQGSIGDCFAVVLQSMQWGMNPFAVAQKTHLVNGVLGYEAQLVNAVITTRAPTKERLKFEWFGDWSKINGKEDKSTDKGVKIWATLKGEDEPRVLELSMAQVGTVRNSPLWQADPRQQLAYLGIKRWSRLYCPDVILGVYTPDEFEEPKEKDITPQGEAEKPNSGAYALKTRLAKKQAVETVATEINLAPYYAAIDRTESLEELATVADDIKKLGLGEPAKSEIGAAYKAKHAALSQKKTMPTESVQAIINELEATKDIDQLNTILASRFEPFTAQMSEQQIDQINAVYERKEAELTS